MKKPKIKIEYPKREARVKNQYKKPKCNRNKTIKTLTKRKLKSYSSSRINHF